MKKNYVLLILFLFIQINCFAQLNDFIFSVSASPATCIGNGVLNFTTSQTNPDATLNFSVYLLPNTATPVATTPATSLTGLNPGNYLVVANQSLGTLNNSQQQEVIIANQITPLNFNLTGTNATCLGGGTINATITSGNPVSYQIINGPVTTPLQTTNAFSGLPAGTYNVRVIDACGQGVVKSFTIIEIVSNPNAITILQNEFPSQWTSAPMTACNLINVGHRIQIAPGSNVVSPLQFIFTVFPPYGGPAITVTHSITISTNDSGTVPVDEPFSFSIPYFDTSYSYNIEVIDACGNSYYRNNNDVNIGFNFNFSASPSSCGFSLSISAQYYTLPLTVDFISSPAGFDPFLFNAQHPTFNTGGAIYQLPGGAPAGTYVVKLTDGCGREVIKINLVEDMVIALPGYSYSNCNQLVANVNVPTRSIVVANFVQVPATSGITLPYDLSDFIQENGTLVISSILSPGTYIISVTDSCGKAHTVPITIAPPPIQTAYAVYFNGCGEDVGSVTVSANATTFISATFISGPTSYQPGFPDDVSEYLSNGAFSMNSLPIGIYVIRTVDTCGNIRNNTLFIDGYFSTTEIEISRFCSSFDLFLNEVNNNSLPNFSYWIQIQNPITGAWQHPVLGGSYIENTVPNATNARRIYNNQLNINIGDTGHYRIITITSVAANGNGQGPNQNCIHIIKEFDVEGTTLINSILNFACSDTISDVYLNVSGSGPFNFRILEKNGNPFIIENNQNPLFTNLETGVYKFQIEDDCGNLTVRIHNVFSPVIFSVIPSLCMGQYSTLSVPDFPYLEYEWFKQGAENVILSINATLPFNALNFNIHSGIYYVNIIYPPNLDSCLNQMLSFEISPNMVPNAGEDSNNFICNSSNSIDLNSYLNGNFDENGTWEQINPSGNLNVNIWNLQGVENGIYQFKYAVNGLCGFIDEAIITLEILGQIDNPEIAPTSAICVGDSINLQITNPNSSYAYSWTGPNNFTSNSQNIIIENATINMSGTYTVTITAGSCQTFSSVEIAVISLPEFNFLNDTIVLCQGQSGSITVIPASVINTAYNYVWDFEGEEIAGENTNTIEVSQTGTYNVTISSGECSIVKTLEVTENTNVFEVGILGNCANNSSIINAFAINNSFNEATASYLWSGPNNFYGNTQSVDISNLETGIYAVVVTDESGCSVGAFIGVKNTNCRIPKGVSPNGDGQNDTWDLSGFNIEKVKIFNRYGLEVFEQSNYEDEWHGQSFNGKLLPTATYYYYIRSSSGEEITGWVYLNGEVK